MLGEMLPLAQAKLPVASRRVAPVHNCNFPRWCRVSKHEVSLPQAFPEFFAQQLAVAWAGADEPYGELCAGVMVFHLAAMDFVEFLDDWWALSKLGSHVPAQPLLPECMWPEQCTCGTCWPQQCGTRWY